MKRFVNRILRILHVQIHRTAPEAIPYIPARETLKRARAANMTLSEFVEADWGISGNRDLVISEITQSGALAACFDVCEIGPGTGRYLEKILEIAKPTTYEIYETAIDWADYLRDVFGVVPRSADGRTLKATPDQSRDLVHAHGVFVALPLVRVFAYFREMVRVARDGAWIIFDFYPEGAFDVAAVDRWVESSHSYASVLPRNTVIEYFRRAGFVLVHEFWHPHGEGHALYFILRKA